AALGLQTLDRVPRPVERGKRFLYRPWVIVPATWGDEEVGAGGSPFRPSRFRLLYLRAYGLPTRRRAEHWRRQHRDHDPTWTHDPILPRHPRRCSSATAAWVTAWDGSDRLAKRPSTLVSMRVAITRIALHCSEPCAAPKRHSPLRPRKDFAPSHPEARWPAAW